MPQAANGPRFRRDRHPRRSANLAFILKRTVGDAGPYKATMHSVGRGLAPAAIQSDIALWAVIFALCASDIAALLQ